MAITTDHADVRTDIGGAPRSVGRPDVVVVGAGLSGMAAAYTLATDGLEVTVVEAKDRVGGRTHSDGNAQGGPVDLGGMFIGATHHRSRALGESLGLTAVRARPEGSMSYRVDGEVLRASDGGYPEVVAGTDAFDRKLAAAYEQFDEVAERVGASGPWRRPEDLELDRMTVAAWLDRNVDDPVIRRLMTTDLNIIVGADTSEMSMLFWAQYVAKCEGMRALQVTAQDSLWVGGAQQIAERVADLPGVTVLTDWPVESVVHGPDGVTVASPRGRLTAPAAVIAVPPSAAHRIDFTPPLPHARRQLQARAPMGRETKVQARYARPFWREAGLSGEIFDLELGYLALDVTRPGDECATIVGFIGGRDYDRWAALSDDERRTAFLESLTSVLGPEAAEPLAFFETDWPSVPHTMGAPVTVMPPGLLSTTAAALTESVGPLHFAGTEAAPMWTGYMEGAVQAGEAAAHRILAIRPVTTPAFR
ncbi:flavin monoamine oxidase family protein [Streptomyces sp. BH097]|uniref:flavin monoamine oxidase family protein n=1 Tax=unclassified Streptomyces TaxID=2593676 RepID=UPI003BB70BA7